MSATRYAVVVVLKDGKVRKYRAASAMAAHSRVSQHRERTNELGTAELYADSYATADGRRIRA